MKRMLFAAVMVAVGVLGNVDISIAQPDRPLLFIPDVLASRLSEPNGRVLWGNQNSFLNMESLELTPGIPARKLRPDGLADSINVLGPFLSIDNHRDLLIRLQELGYIPNKSLFTFPYDWRQSHFESAQALASFVESTPALRSGSFDILAHGNGEIIAKLWMLEQRGASKVGKAIYIGVPFQGAMSTIGTLSTRWGTFGNLVRGGIDSVRRIMLSFPSTYEMLPSYEGCCRLGGAGQFRALDVLDPQTWTQRDWLPQEYRTGGQRADVFQSGLERARRLSELMRRVVPGVKETRVVGNAHDTPSLLYVPRENQSWRSWIFEHGSGDGTVPVVSAAAGDVATAVPVSAPHARLYSDAALWIQLATLLGNSGRRTMEGSGDAKSASTSAVRGSQRVTAAVEPPITDPRSSARVILDIEPSSSIAQAAVGPYAVMHSTGGTPVVFQLIEVSGAKVGTPPGSAVRFQGNFVAPDVEGTYRIDVLIPGQIPLSAFLTVIKASEKPVSVDEKDLTKLERLLRAPEGLYPAPVALTLDPRGSFCTGVLVRPEWVATTSHCAAPFKPHEITVHYGAPDLRQAKKVSVKSLVQHENYSNPTPSSSNFSNDLALLRLERPIEVAPIEIGESPSPASAPLQREDDVRAGSFVVSGWGSFFAGGLVGNTQPQLTIQRHLTVRRIPREQCNATESYNGNVSPDQLCASSVFTSVDACQGFGGAPLMFVDRGVFKVQAIVTWGEGCAEPNKPTVYTNLAYHSEWITKMAGPPVPALTPPAAAQSGSAVVTPSPPPPGPAYTLKQSPVDPMQQIAEVGRAPRIGGPSLNVAPRGVYRNMVSIRKAGSDPLIGHFCGGILLTSK